MAVIPALPNSATQKFKYKKPVANRGKNAKLIATKYTV